MKQQEKTEAIAILGGGLAGVSLGAALSEKYVNFRIFEANEQIGGLARTFKTETFSWDLGVHALYSRDPQFVERLNRLPIEYQYCRRDVKICHTKGDRIYPLAYPFENGLRDLPADDLKACLDGYRKARVKKEVKSYKHLEDWIDNGLGYGFSRVFMTPYNRKIWNAPLSEISMDLVSNKIEPEPYEKVLSYAKGGASVGRSYQARFLYPKNGIQSLCDHFARVCGERIFVNRKVTAIRRTGNGFSLHFENGEAVNGFKRIVSTIPLKILIDCLPYTALKSHKDNLMHNDTVFVMVGLKQGAQFKRFGDNHWSFYAGDEIFYRLTMMRTFSDYFPISCVAEHTVHPTDKLDLEHIKKQVVKDLLRRGILRSETDMGAVKVHYEPFTYPIPTINLKPSKTYIKKYLEDRDIYLLGRNGNWDYINMDQVLMDADRMAEVLFLQDSP